VLNQQRIIIMRKFAFIAVFLMPSMAFSAIPKSDSPKSNLRELPKSKSIEMTMTALRLPTEQRLEAIKLRGDESLENLIQIATKDQFSLSLRWKAVTAIGRVFPLRSKKILYGMTSSKEWYLRNAALIALQAAYAPLALKAALRLVRDKALVVRTAAVKIIEDLGSRRQARVLWGEINSPKNFRKGKSLWIRSHIMRAIAKTAGAGDELKLSQFIQDKDPQVQLWALYGLEKASGTKAQNKGLSFKQRKQKWISWSRKKQRDSQSL